jgi:hypothetical protein
MGKEEGSNTENNRITIKIVLEHLVGLDVATISEMRKNEIAAVRCLFIGGSVFWCLQQVAAARMHNTFVMSDQDMFEAFTRLGELGEAVTNAALEYVEALAREDGREQR